LPIIGRYLDLLVKSLNLDNSNNRSSPFRMNNKNVIRNIISIHPLNKLSMFTTIFIPTAVSNEFNYSFKFNGSLTICSVK